MGGSAEAACKQHKTRLGEYRVERTQSRRQSTSKGSTRGPGHTNIHYSIASTERGSAAKHKSKGMPSTTSMNSQTRTFKSASRSSANRTVTERKEWHKKGILLCWSLKNEAAFEAELHEHHYISTMLKSPTNHAWYEGATSGEIKSGFKGRACIDDIRCTEPMDLVHDPGGVDSACKQLD